MEPHAPRARSRLSVCLSVCCCLLYLPATILEKKQLKNLKSRLPWVHVIFFQMQNPLPPRGQRTNGCRAPAARSEIGVFYPLFGVKSIIGFIFCAE